MTKRSLKEIFFTKKELNKVNESSITDPPKITEEDKQRIMSSIREYNNFGKMIYRKNNLSEIAKTLHEIATFAERFTVESANDWFDQVTIKRNMKELKGLSGNFMKVANEAQSLQDRMNALYEDMGNVLNRYFEIDDPQPEQPVVQEDDILRVGDKATVDMNAVRKVDPTPHYIRKVKDEVNRGHGTVKVQAFEGKYAYVSGSEYNLFEVRIPTIALRKAKERIINELIKFDAKKMERYMEGDKFLTSQLKMIKGDKGRKLEVLFNTYVLGDSVEERKYNQVK